MTDYTPNAETAPTHEELNLEEILQNLAKVPEDFKKLDSQKIETWGSAHKGRIGFALSWLPLLKALPAHLQEACEKPPNFSGYY